MAPATPGGVTPVTLPPGWYAVYSGPGAAANAEVRTYSAYASFAIGPDESIDPALTASGWTASYSGVVEIEEPGKYRFMVESQGGTASLSVRDLGTEELGKAKPVTPGSLQTEWLQLPAGKVQLTVKFTKSAGAGKGARLRSMWEMERGSLGTGFYPEPIPTSMVSAPKFGAPFAAAGYAALQGRVLLGEAGCLHCHSAQKTQDTVIASRTSPYLGEIGRRASPAWLLQWIMNPHELRSGSYMPDVFGETPQDRAQAEAIVQFLVAPYYSDSDWTQPAAQEQSVLSRGRELYHTIGCIECHGALESPQAVYGEQGLSASVPKVKVPLVHGLMGGKWKLSELAAFLKDPMKIRPSGRMPSMSLGDEEADMLANYLLSVWKSPPAAEGRAPFKPEPSKVQEGMAAFAARGCAGCHQMGGNLPDIASTLKAPPLAALTGDALARGCLDPKDTRTPRYHFDEAQAAQIKAGLESALKATGTPAPIDAENRRIVAMNCRGCHVKDGQGGVPGSLRAYLRTTMEIDLGDEARVPPHVNLVGWKLSTPWLRDVLTAGGRARPYMATRMPQFGAANIGALPAQLAAVAGVWPDSDRPEPKTSDQTVLDGRRLVGDGGLNCISCHAFGKLPPAGAPGPNIAAFAGRLRYEWWHTYALGPARQKPGTRMPFFFASGKSTKTDVLDGDPDRQIDALWAYFNLASSAPPPSGVQTGKGLALSVGDRPRIFRTFMKDAGSRGIAVGFPAGTHFGFDAGACRLVDAWKGDFIDASGAWANRGGTVADGQGQVVWTAPPGPAILVGNSAPSPWPAAAPGSSPMKFGGYRLDAAGVPTFMYHAGAVEVEETFTPVSGGIRRAFKVTGVPAGASIFCNAGGGNVTIEKLANVADASAGGGNVWAITAQDAGKAVEFAVVVK